MTTRKPKPKKRHGRVHAICAKCYRRSTLQREPIPVALPLCYYDERCCFCMGRTHDGIYVRTTRVPRPRCCVPGKYPKKLKRAAGPVYGMIRTTREGTNLRYLVVDTL